MAVATMDRVFRIRFLVLLACMGYLHGLVRAAVVPKLEIGGDAVDGKLPMGLLYGGLSTITVRACGFQWMDPDGEQAPCQFLTNEDESTQGWTVPSMEDPSDLFTAFFTFVDIDCTDGGGGLDISADGETLTLPFNNVIQPGEEGWYDVSTDISVTLSLNLGTTGDDKISRQHFETDVLAESILVLTNANYPGACLMTPPSRARTTSTLLMTGALSVQLTLDPGVGFFDSSILTNTRALSPFSGSSTIEPSGWTKLEDQLAKEDIVIVPYSFDWSASQTRLLSKTTEESLDFRPHDVVLFLPLENDACPKNEGLFHIAGIEAITGTIEGADLGLSIHYFVADGEECEVELWHLDELLEAQDIKFSFIAAAAIEFIENPVGLASGDLVVLYGCGVTTLNIIPPDTTPQNPGSPTLLMFDLTTGNRGDGDSRVLVEDCLDMKLRKLESTTVNPTPTEDDTYFDGTLTMPAVLTEGNSDLTVGEWIFLSCSNMAGTDTGDPHGVFGRIESIDTASTSATLEGVHMRGSAGPSDAGDLECDGSDSVWPLQVRKVVVSQQTSEIILGLSPPLTFGLTADEVVSYVISSSQKLIDTRGGDMYAGACDGEWILRSPTCTYNTDTILVEDVRGIVSTETPSITLTVENTEFRFSSSDNIRDGTDSFTGLGLETGGIEQVDTIINSLQGWNRLRDTLDVVTAGGSGYAADSASEDGEVFTIVYDILNDPPTRGLREFESGDILYFNSPDCSSTLLYLLSVVDEDDQEILTTMYDYQQDAAADDCSGSNIQLIELRNQATGADGAATSVAADAPTIFLTGTDESSTFSEGDIVIITEVDGCLMLNSPFRIIDINIDGMTMASPILSGSQPCTNGKMVLVTSTKVDLESEEDVYQGNRVLQIATESAIGLLAEGDIIYLDCNDLPGVSGSYGSTVTQVKHVNADGTEVTMIDSTVVGSNSCNGGNGLNVNILHPQEGNGLTVPVFQNGGYFPWETSDLMWSIPASALTTAQDLICKPRISAVKAGTPTLDPVLEADSLSGGWWNNQANFAITYSQAQSGTLFGSTLKLRLGLAWEWAILTDEQRVIVLESFTSSVEDIEDIIVTGIVADSDTEYLDIEFPGSEEDFDLEEVATIVIELDIGEGDAPLTVLDANLESLITWDDVLLVYPDGYLDPVEDLIVYAVTDTSNDIKGGRFASWTHGLTTYEILSYQISCEDVDTQLWVQEYVVEAVPPSVNFIAWEVDTTTPSPAEGNTCRLVATNIYGDKMTSSAPVTLLTDSSVMAAVLGVQMTSEEGGFEAIESGNSVRSDVNAGSSSMELEGSCQSSPNLCIRNGAILQISSESQPENLIVQVEEIDGSVIFFHSALPSAIAADAEVLLYAGGTSSAKVITVEDYGVDLSSEEFYRSGTASDGSRILLDDLDSVEDDTLVQRDFDKNTVEIQQLVYGRTYSLQFWYSNDDVDPYTKAYSFTQVYTIPAKTLPPILASATEDSMLLKWAHPPADGGFAISKYTVECTPNLLTYDYSQSLNFIAEATETDYHGVVIPRVIMSGLEPFTRYYCRVNAHNELGTSYGYWSADSPLEQTGQLTSTWDDDAPNEIELTGALDMLFPGLVTIGDIVVWALNQDDDNVLYLDQDLSEDPDFADVYLLRHLYTTPSDGASAVPSPPSSLEQQQSWEVAEDAEGQLVRYTWSAPATDVNEEGESLTNALTDTYTVALYLYQDSEEWESVSTTCIDNDVFEYSFCDVGIGCDYELSTIESGHWYRFEVVAVSESGVQSALTEVYTLLHGSGAEGEFIGRCGAFGYYDYTLANMGWMDWADFVPGINDQTIWSDLPTIPEDGATTTGDPSSYSVTVRDVDTTFNSVYLKIEDLPCAYVNDGTFSTISNFRINLDDSRSPEYYEVEVDPVEFLREGTLHVVVSHLESDVPVAADVVFTAFEESSEDGEVATDDNWEGLVAPSAAFSQREPIRAYPPSVTQDENESTSLLVTWQIPGSDGGSPLRSYDVQYRVETGTWTTVSLRATSTEVLLTSLEPRATYLIRVRACNSQVFHKQEDNTNNKAVCGQWSDEVMHTVGPEEEQTDIPSLSITGRATTSFALALDVGLQKTKSSVVNRELRCITGRFGNADFFQGTNVVTKIGHHTIAEDFVSTAVDAEVTQYLIRGLESEVDYSCVARYFTYSGKVILSNEVTGATTAYDEAPGIPLPPTPSLVGTDEINGVFLFFEIPPFTLTEPTEDDGVDACQIVVRNSDDDVSGPFCPTTDSLYSTSESVEGTVRVLTEVFDNVVEAFSIQKVYIEQSSLDIVYDDNPQEDEGLGFFYCVAVRCKHTVADTYSRTSPPTLFQAAPNVPDEILIRETKVMDRAALLRWEESESTSRGSAITDYDIQCTPTEEGNSASISQSLSQLPKTADGSYVTEAHIGDLEPGTSYLCFVAGVNEIGTGLEKEATITLKATTGGEDGTRLHPIHPRPPELAENGIEVVDTDGSTFYLAPLTQMSVRLQWEELCVHLTDPSECYGSADTVFFSASASGTATVQDRHLVEGDEEVRLLGYYLRYRCSQCGKEFLYLSYSADRFDTENDLINLFGGETYEFQLAAYSNYFALVKSTSPSELNWSTSMFVTIASPSRPDPMPTVDLSGDDWHTRSGLWLSLGDVGQDHDSIIANGGQNSRYEAECRRVDDDDWSVTWETVTVTKGKSVADLIYREWAIPSIAITSLLSNTEYDCRARATNEFGVGDWGHIYNTASSRHITDSEQNNPMRLNQPVLVDVGMFSTKLLWAPPVDTDGTPLLGYKIFMNGEEVTEVGTGDDLEYLTSGLLARGSYSFTVASYNRFYLSCDEEIKATGISAESPPLVVTTNDVDGSILQSQTAELPGLEVWDIGQTHAILAWEHPILKSSMEDVVMIMQWAKVEDGEDNLDWESDDINLYGQPGWDQYPIRYVSELDKSTLYLFRVKFSGLPTGAQGPITVFSDSLLGETSSELVPLSPLPVSDNGEDVVIATIDSPTDSEFARFVAFDIGLGTISGETGDTGGALVAGYKVVVTADPVDGTISGIHPSAKVETSNQALHFGDDLTSLEPNVHYHFSVSYVDTSGRESKAYEDFVVQLSSCGKPDAVDGIKLVTSANGIEALQAEALLLEWTEPSSGGSPITAYEIECNEEEDFSANSKVQLVPDYRFLQWYIDGLTPGSTYWCRVNGRAQTKACSTQEAEAGAGPYVIPEVQDRAPIQMVPPFAPECTETSTVLNAATYEPSFYVLDIGWTDSDLNDLVGGGDTSSFGYNLQYKGDGEWTYVALDTLDDVEGGGLVHTFTGLTASTVYRFRVRSWNIDAVGEWSHEYRSSAAYGRDPLSREPDTPENIEISDLTQAAVHVSWDILNDGGAFVHTVLIQCQRGEPVGDDTDPWTYERETDGDTETADDTDGFVWMVSNGVRVPSEVDAIAYGIEADGTDEQFYIFCRVQALNENGASKWSTPVSSGQNVPTASGQPLSLPRLRLDFLSKESATIAIPAAFDDDGSPILGYRIWDESGSFELEETSRLFPGLQKVAYRTFTGLTEGTNYVFYVEAYNKHVYDNVPDDEYEAASIPSPPLKFSTLIGERPLMPPTLAVKEPLHDSILFQVRANSDDGGSPINEAFITCAPEQLAADGVTSQATDPYDEDLRVVETVCSSEEECAEEWRTSFTIDQLSDDTNYYCQYVVRNKFGRTFGLVSETPYFTTQEDTDKIMSLFRVPEVVIVTKTTISIDWIPSLGGTVSSYQVRWEDVATAAGLSAMDVDIGTEAVIEGLEPYTTYKISVQAQNTVSASPSILVTTDPGPPAAPTNFISVSASHTSVLFGWEPASTNGAEIFRYSVGCAFNAAALEDFSFTGDVENDDVDIIERDGVYYTYLTGLIFDQEYACRMRAENEAGPGDWSAIKEFTTGPELIEGDEQTPIAMAPPALWAVPGEFEDSYSGPYNLRADSLKVVWGEELSWNEFTDGTYENFKTNLLGFIVRYGPTSSDWETSHYDKWIWGDVFDESNRYLIVTGLLASNTYAFRVLVFSETSSNERLFGDWSPPLEVSTKGGSAPDVPPPPLGLDVSQHVVVLNIDSSSNGSPILEYQAECREEQSSEYTYTETSSRSIIYVGVKKNDATATYRCRAKAINVRGDSGWSYDSYVIQLQGTIDSNPLMMLPIEAVSQTSSSVFISFSPGPLPGGNSPYEATFEISYTDSGTYDLQDDESRESRLDWTVISFTRQEACDTLTISSEWTCKEHIFTSDRTSIVFGYDITGLVGNTAYYFSVRATAGNHKPRESPWSVVDVPFVTNPTDKPDPVEGLQLVDFSSTGFLFTWDAPNSNGAVIDMYEIQCSPTPFSEALEDEIVRNFPELMSASDRVRTEMFIGNLVEDTSYYCRVQATNVIGTTNGIAATDSASIERPFAEAEDQLGSTVLFKTAQENVQNLLRMATPTFNSATWNTLTMDLLPGPDQVLYSGFHVYFVETHLEDTSVPYEHEETQGTLGSITLTALDSNTEYVFWVRARTDNENDSPYSQEFVGSTLPGEPAGFASGVSVLTFDVASEIQTFDCDAASDKLCILLGMATTQCLGECLAASVKLSVTVFGDKHQSSEELVQKFVDDENLVDEYSEIIETDVNSFTFTHVDTAILLAANDAMYVDWPTMDSRGSEITKYELECDQPGFDGKYSFASGARISVDIFPRDDGVAIESEGAIDDIDPDADYKCRVSAFNEVGSFLADIGDESEAIHSPPLDTFIKPLKLSRPYQSSSGPDTLAIQWSTPLSAGGEDLNGDSVAIVSYSIKYELADEEGDETTITMNALTIQLTGLLPGQRYRFSVSANNLETGTVVWSEYGIGSTDVSTPAKPKAMTGVAIDDSTLEIYLYSVNDDGNSIIGGIPVDRYVVQFASAIFNEETNEFEGDFETAFPGFEEWPFVVEIGGETLNLDRSVTISSLDPEHKDYLLRYALVNELGVGEWSDAVHLLTTVVPPSQPLEPTLFLDDRNRLVLQWESPTSDGGADITEYSACVDVIFPDNVPNFGELECKRGDPIIFATDLTDIFWAVFETDGEVKNLFTVRGGTYTGVVRAENEIGESPLSEKTEEFAIPAGAPYPPSVDVVSSRATFEGEVLPSWQATLVVNLAWDGGLPYEEVECLLVQTDKNTDYEDSVTIIPTTETTGVTTALGVFEGLLENSNYRVQIVAKNSGGESSTTVEFDTVPEPTSSAPSRPVEEEESSDITVVVSSSTSRMPLAAVGLMAIVIGIVLPLLNQ